MNGNVANATGMVICNRNALVNIMAVNPGNGSSTIALSADGSLKSKLRVNKVDGGAGANISVPGNSAIVVDFSSELIRVGNVSPGNFNATAVAVMNIF